MSLNKKNYSSILGDLRSSINDKFKGRNNKSLIKRVETMTGDIKGLKSYNTNTSIDDRFEMGKSSSLVKDKKLYEKKPAIGVSINNYLDTRNTMYSSKKPINTNETTKSELKISFNYGSRPGSSAVNYSTQHAKSKSFFTGSTTNYERHNEVSPSKDKLIKNFKNSKNDDNNIKKKLYEKQNNNDTTMIRMNDNDSSKNALNISNIFNDYRNNNTKMANNNSFVHNTTLLNHLHNQPSYNNNNINNNNNYKTATTLKHSLLNNLKDHHNPNNTSNINDDTALFNSKYFTNNKQDNTFINTTTNNNVNWLENKRNNESATNILSESYIGEPSSNKSKRKQELLFKEIDMNIDHNLSKIENEEKEKINQIQDKVKIYKNALDDIINILPEGKQILSKINKGYNEQIDQFVHVIMRMNEKIKENEVIKTSMLNLFLIV